MIALTSCQNNAVTQVAVAVIHYQQQFLLAYRHAKQHQGDRYEFIGGKVEKGERIKTALIREVGEEINCDISQNPIIAMGVIRHQYPEKQVALHVYKIEVTKAQFTALQSEFGAENQPIVWVNRQALLKRQYTLPEANARILDWLKLNDIIYISQPLHNFTDAAAWVQYYQSRLPQQAQFYIRPQTDIISHQALITQLCEQRNDLRLVINYEVIGHLFDKVLTHCLAVHLNHQQLLSYQPEQLASHLYYFASCHDDIQQRNNSLNKINQLSQTHSVLGCFLSPVKATPSHVDAIPLGWQHFEQLASTIDVPVFALGGINRADVKTAQTHDGYGIAGIRLLE